MGTPPLPQLPIEFADYDFEWPYHVPRSWTQSAVSIEHRKLILFRSPGLEHETTPRSSSDQPVTPLAAELFSISSRGIYFSPRSLCHWSAAHAHLASIRADLLLHHHLYLSPLYSFQQPPCLLSLLWKPNILFRHLSLSFFHHYLAQSSPLSDGVPPVHNNVSS